MEILQLTANQFLRPMGNGRTHPVLLGAEDANGRFFEVVVKLRGPELTTKSQIAELVTAQLADLLEIQVPTAAVVEVPKGFEAVAYGSHVTLLQNSSGFNFGSVHLGASFTTWPSGRLPIGIQRDQAAEIFALDLLVQNPDRRAVNPNLWVRSDQLGVYDHEQAFSFLHLPILGDFSCPWHLVSQATGFRFMENHVFYPQLKGARVELGPFETRLEALSDDAIQALLNPVPAEWRDGHDLCEKIASYLHEAREERTAFMNFVKHLLR